jgi:hypothetical protein
MMKNYPRTLLLFALSCIAYGTLAQGNASHSPVFPGPLGTAVEGKKEMKLYGRLFVGYGAAIAKTNIGTNTTTVQNNQGPPTTTVEAVNGSYGQGIYTGIGAGWRLMEHFGFGLDFVNHSGTTLLFKSVTANPAGGSNTTTERVHKGFSVRPMATFFVHPYKSLTAFGELGLIVGLGDKMINTVTSTNPGLETITERKMTHTFRPGGVAGVGAAWHVTKKMSVMGLLQVQGQSFVPKRDEVVTFTINGQDKLSTLTVAGRETEYSNRLENVTVDPNKPFQTLATARTLNSFNILVGICFGFGGTPQASSSAR